MREAIVEEVIKQITKDLEEGNIEALELLLVDIPMESLLAYLPDGYFDKTRN